MSITDLFNALFKEDQREAPARYIAKHLAKVSLHELKGVNALHPDVMPLASELIKRARTQGMSIEITETFRPASLQQKYYEQGRKSPGSIITNAKPLESYHQYGLAFDIKFSGTVPYPNDPLIWERVGFIGEKIGLIWGGRFEDKPHFEYHPGYSYKELIDYFKL